MAITMKAWTGKINKTIQKDKYAELMYHLSLGCENFVDVNEQDSVEKHV